jgi:hypothetical protein
MVQNLSHDKCVVIGDVAEIISPNLDVPINAAFVKPTRTIPVIRSADNGPKPVVIQASPLTLTPDAMNHRAVVPPA